MVPVRSSDHVPYLFSIQLMCQYKQRKADETQFLTLISALDPKELEGTADLIIVIPPPADIHQTLKSRILDIFAKSDSTIVELVSIKALQKVSVDEKNHRDDLSRALEKLDQHRLVINHWTCIFEGRELTFLGFLISKDGISPHMKEVEGIKSYCHPKAVDRLRRFLATFNFYHKFF